MELTKKGQTPHMFNTIASRYDFINRVLSLGLDMSWRRKLVSMIPDQRPLSVVDVAAGTGDQTLALLKSEHVQSVVALDPSVEMLRVAQKKIKDAGIHKSVEFELARAEEMPFLDATFDVATMSFGIRNVPDVQIVLKELYRVLRPAGNLYILEFSFPKSLFIRPFHRFYIRYVVPLVGGLLSGSREAYSYLDKSVEAFPYGEAFVNELRKAGFSSAEAHPLWFGIVTVYVAQR